MQLFVEHLTVIDSAYLCATHGIVGESWIVDATLHGELDPQSMVMDFGHVKKKLKAAIDDSVDHTLIVPEQSPNLDLSRSTAVNLTWRFGQGEQLVHSSPAQALTLLPANEVNDAAMIAWLERELMGAVPANVTRVEIALRHEDATPAHYHYAHGLKKHDGNCQRIAHGHRSRVMIWRNGARDETLERSLARELDHSYLATADDRASAADGMSEFAYRSDQGEFRLAYPTARIHLLNSDSTVECIAQYLANLLKERDSSASFMVRAYEGVHKGAIASA